MAFCDSWNFWVTLDHGCWHSEKYGNYAFSYSQGGTHGHHATCWYFSLDLVSSRKQGSFAFHWRRMCFERTQKNLGIFRGRQFRNSCPHNAMAVLFWFPFSVAGPTCSQNSKRSPMLSKGRDSNSFLKTYLSVFKANPPLSAKCIISGSFLRHNAKLWVKCAFCSHITSSSPQFNSLFSF